LIVRLTALCSRHETVNVAIHTAVSSFLLLLVLASFRVSTIVATFWDSGKVQGGLTVTEALLQPKYRTDLVPISGKGGDELIPVLNSLSTAHDNVWVNGGVVPCIRDLGSVCR
jgi:hypothetical protein